MRPKSPDVSEISLMDLPSRPFPTLPDFRITISAPAYEIIHRHAKEDTSIEICGVLLGEILKDDDGPYLAISEAIRGENAASQEAQVMFTQETWAHIYDIKDSQFPDHLIVGWYHTHPRYGIFLSPQDRFIHKNFFNQPWQVAYVVDPVSEEEGFFVWLDGVPDQTKHYWVGGKEKVRASNSPPPDQPTDKVTKDPLENRVSLQKPGIRPLYFMLGLLFITGLIVLNFYTLKSKSQEIVSSLEGNFDKLGIALRQIQSAPVDTSSKIEEIKKAINNINILSDMDLQFKQNGSYIWVNGKVYTYNLKEVVGKTIAAIAGVESVDLQGVNVTHRYNVKPGESLSHIAKKIYGNTSKWRDIYQANRELIKDPDRLQAFITITLPEVN